MAKYMLARYRTRRNAAIEILGGKCVICGSIENLEIDHIDPSTKTMSVSKMWSCSQEKYDAEIQLCQLLCNEHHKAKTSQELRVPHGGGVSGKRNCPCELCRAKKREYYLMRS